MSRQSTWRRFVEQRRVDPDLRALYPCAAPTHHHLCPRHGCRIGVLTGLCHQCREELYARLAQEYPEKGQP